MIQTWLVVARRADNLMAQISVQEVDGLIGAVRALEGTPEAVSMTLTKVGMEQEIRFNRTDEWEVQVGKRPDGPLDRADAGRLEEPEADVSNHLRDADGQA